MPVYVYRNLRTGETFEVEQRITESAWTEHPENGDPVKRLVQPVGIAFKGAGFYATDSRGSAKPGANGAKGGGDTTASGDGASGADGAASPSGDGSKGAAKSDGKSSGASDGKGGATSDGASSASGSSGKS